MNGELDLNGSIVMIAAAVGYVATMLIDILKPLVCSRLSEMRDGDLAATIKDPLIKALSLVVTGLCALGIGLLAQQYGVLEEGAIIEVLVLSFPGAGAWFQVESRRKSTKTKAQAAMIRPPNPNE